MRKFQIPMVEMQIGRMDKDLSMMKKDVADINHLVNQHWYDLQQEVIWLKRENAELLRRLNKLESKY